MVTGFLVFVLASCALALCAAGFAANTRRFERTMHPPGFYWAWGAVAALIMSMLIGLPLWIRVVNFVVLLMTCGMWLKDRRRESA